MKSKLFQVGERRHDQPRLFFAVNPLVLCNAEVFTDRSPYHRTGWQTGEVVGIERGASDFIVKGTDRQVMLARVRGALRERASGPGAVVRGRLHVDAFRGEARLGDRQLKLERRPLLMLQLLANHSGEVVTRSELLELVWGSSYTGFEHSMEQAVHQIRRELREPGWIETVRGIGYRLVVQA